MSICFPKEKKRKAESFNVANGGTRLCTLAIDKSKIANAFLKSIVRDSCSGKFRKQLMFSIVPQIAFFNRGASKDSIIAKMCISVVVFQNLRLCFISQKKAKPTWWLEIFMEYYSYGEEKSPRFSRNDQQFLMQIVKYD